MAKYLADGVPAYFGYPHAHEDDAERAVRAGLELITTVAALLRGIFSYSGNRPGPFPERDTSILP